jgi:selenocysteine lyase/cysteine desulfurase
MYRRDFLKLSSLAPLAAASAAHAQSGSDPLGVRGDFPITRRPGAYLNSAYITPVPSAVASAASAFDEAKATNPISLPDMQAKADEVRGQFARLIHASDEEIGFLASTSEGENLVAGALDLQRGDNVVIDELHYQTEFVLYKHLERTRGIVLRVVPARDGAVAVRDFEPLVDARTRLVSVALVSHRNGFRHDLKPLADLAHAHGAWLYTDAIQAAGMIPIDVRASGVDALCAGTYKWLLGGFGTAPFFLRRELHDRVVPDRWGALHVAKDLGGYRYEIFTSAKKFEYATLAFGAVYALGAGLAYLERVGLPRIEAHTSGLAHRVRDGLVARGFEVLTPPGNRSSIVSMRNPAEPARMQQALKTAGIEVSHRENGKELRISPALFNVNEDIDAFLRAVEPFGSGTRRSD